MKNNHPPRADLVSIVALVVWLISFPAWAQAQSSVTTKECTAAQSAAPTTGAPTGDNLAPCPNGGDTSGSAPEQPNGSNSPLAAQPANQVNAPPSGNSDAYLFSHSQTSPFWVSGQANFIWQYHPAFTSPYSGANSFSAPAQWAGSRVFTLYTGVQFAPHSEFLFDVESAGGTGLGNALGIAGYPNLDVVRNPTLGPLPYMARAIIHQTIPLSSEMVSSDRGPLSLATEVPAQRIDLYFGKMSMVDFFDNNAFGSDSHRQFMNWAIANNAAYDYAADTRGYTYAFMAQYESPRWGVRFGEALMPTVANGLILDWDVARARAENLEFEYREHLINDQTGTIRFLTYVNHANMGDYTQAIQNYKEGLTPVPDIVSTREQGRVKYGFGLNIEQPVSNDVGLFARAGWNEGNHESYVYTEANNTVAMGAVVQGRSWSRPSDKMGVALFSNGLSSEHREYLALGGQGFLLGDGKLNYGRENGLETFYTARVAPGVTAGPDFQYIQNPGYNRDRGPVAVFGFRVHFEF